MFNTPSPIKKLPPGTETFLAQNMNRPDLAPLMFFLMKEFAGNWAVSGSVALQMHAIHQDALNAMTRMPADVDIVMPSQKVDSLQEILRKNNYASQIERSPFSDNPSTIRFNDLKVDVLRAGRGNFGNLVNTVHIGGLPILSLKQLIASKQAALRVAQEECMKVATQYEGDLRVLEILQQKQCDNERTSSAASRAALRNADPCENRTKRKLFLPTTTAPTFDPDK